MVVFGNQEVLIRLCHVLQDEMDEASSVGFSLLYVEHDTQESTINTFLLSKIIREITKNPFIGMCRKLYNKDN